MDAIERLGTKAADLAAFACFDWLLANGWTRTEMRERVAEISGAVRSTAPKAALAALDDAREALDCRMPEAAEATFRASMRLAGIEAAKLVHAHCRTRVLQSVEA